MAAALLKQREWSEDRFRIYHDRHRDDEVDLVIERADGTLVLIEVTSSRGVDPSSWWTMAKLQQQWGDRVGAAVVRGTGSQQVWPHDWVHVLPEWALWRHPA